MVDVYFYGQACIKVKGKNTSVVFDPYHDEIGFKLPKVEGDIVCVTHNHPDHDNVTGVKGPDDAVPFVINGPGEYEKNGVNIIGVPSFHDDSQGSERGKNTIYNAVVDEVNFVHLGDLGQKKLTQEQVEELSNCDVLFIPVGGVYTIEGKDAPDIIAQIEPKIIVPVHFKLEGLKYDLAPVGPFLAAMGKENLEPVAKLSVSKEKLPDEPEVVLLEASN